MCRWLCKSRQILKVKGSMPDNDLPCTVGAHEAAIIHRTGGLPADQFNTCRKCGREIYLIGSTWVLDTGQRKAWRKQHGND